jgi:hypothetical protein
MQANNTNSSNTIQFTPSVAKDSKDSRLSNTRDVGKPTNAKPTGTGSGSRTPQPISSSEETSSYESSGQDVGGDSDDISFDTDKKTCMISMFSIVFCFHVIYLIFLS